MAAEEQRELKPPPKAVRIAILVVCVCIYPIMGGKDNLVAAVIVTFVVALVLNVLAVLYTNRSARVLSTALLSAHLAAHAEECGADLSEACGGEAAAKWHAQALDGHLARHRSAALLTAGVVEGDESTAAGPEGGGSSVGGVRSGDEADEAAASTENPVAAEESPV